MSDQAKEPQTPAEAPASSLELDDQAYARYLLYSKTEIHFLLKTILQKKCLFTVYFDGGRSFFLTSLVALSEDGAWLYFDYGADESINRRALDAKKLMFTTALDRVKVQFSIKGLQTVSSGGRNAFAGKAPETVLRLQRREHFRLTTPIANPLRCSLQIPLPNGGIKALDLPLLDISGGGIALMVQGDDIPLFQPGVVVSNCKLTVPEEGPITFSAVVRNGFPVTTKSGASYVRVGCEFMDLANNYLNQVQRYITRMERERKARLAGLE